MATSATNAQSLSFVNTAFANSKLSALTMKNRLSALSKYNLTKDNYIKVLSDINNVDDPTRSINSRTTYMFHVIALLRALPESEANKKLLKMYTSKVDELKKQQLAKNKANTMTKGDYIPLETLQRDLNSREPDFDEFVSTYKTFEEAMTFYKQYEKHLLLSMYVNMPATRNDLYKCRIIHSQKELNDTDNFILVSPRAVYLFLTQYKTAGRYGPIRLDVGKINDRLVRNILKLRRMLKVSNPFLFTHVSKKGLSTIADETTLIQRIRKESVDYFGKAQSINSFRHSWEIHIQHSDEYKNATIAEREAIHMKLLHSLGTALYYNSQTRD